MNRIKFTEFRCTACGGKMNLVNPSNTTKQEYICEDCGQIGSVNE